MMKKQLLDFDVGLVMSLDVINVMVLFKGPCTHGMTKENSESIVGRIVA